jgi:hypothetical protein
MTNKINKPENPYYSNTDTELHLTDAEWKKVLPNVYEVTRNADTERPFTGKYWNTDEKNLLLRCLRQSIISFWINFLVAALWLFEQDNKDSVIYKKIIHWAWHELRLFVVDVAAI